jgi:transposase
MAWRPQRNSVCDLKSARVGPFLLTRPTVCGFRVMFRGWICARIGQRANGLVDWGAKGRTNAISACINSKLITATEFNCTIDTEVFHWWVVHDLIPNLHQKTPLIIDNATFHRHAKIRGLLDAHGHKLVFLPKYSPHLNPIEHTWHEKKALRRRTQCSVENLFA